MNTSFTDDKKKELLMKLTGILLDAREQDLVTEEQTREIAYFILAKKDSITDDITLKLFLDELAIKSVIFKDFAEQKKTAQTAQTQDNQKVQEIQDQLSNLGKFN